MKHVMVKRLHGEKELSDANIDGLVFPRNPECSAFVCMQQGRSGSFTKQRSSNRVPDLDPATIDWIVHFDCLCAFTDSVDAYFELSSAPNTTSIADDVMSPATVAKAT